MLSCPAILCALKIISTMQSLEFDLVVYAPYRSIEGFINDMEVSLAKSFGVLVSPPPSVLLSQLTEYCDTHIWVSKLWLSFWLFAF